MNAAFAPYLAVVLFLPWFAILATLFCLLPREPRTVTRRRFDAVALAFGVLAFVASVRVAHGVADPRFGGMWPQVLATAVGYGVFLCTLGGAFLARRHILRTPDARDRR